MPLTTAISVRPPTAAVRPAVRTLGGVGLDDPYAWLENRDDPEVVAYLEAENAYRAAVMAPTAALQETLYREMLGRIKQSDVDVPVRFDDWLYYSRTEEGLQYPIVARKREPDAPEEILLDPNAMVRTGYIRVVDWMPSPDHRLLAYLLNETGGIERTLYVKNLDTGDRLPEEIPTVAGFAWANDNRTLFYLKQDAALRASALYRHRLRDDPAADPLLYREEDEVFSLGIAPAKDRSFLLLTSASFETSEVRLLPADQPDAAWALFEPRRPGILYWLEHLGDDFLVLTNEDALNFKVVAAPVADPAPANRRELVPHRPDRFLARMDVFASDLVLYGRENGLPQVFVRNHADGRLRTVPLDEPAYSVRGGWNPTFDPPAVRIAYASFVTPNSTEDVDLATLERTLLKREAVPGYDPAAYVSERLWATAGDGARVPISLVRRRDAPEGPLPTLLYGYGAYGISSDPGFHPLYDAYRPSLLDRGMAIAIAHVRGGEEMGRAWYEEGKLLRKKNSFTDFVACAEHLVAEGRTESDRLVFAGGSAGGLLMGAVANLRPDLARAIVAWVPFVDVLRVMLDSSLPLTTGEYVEWGNPADPVVRDYIASYSPYDNVEAKRYPTMLLTGGLNDHQVPFWQPAKWAAKLRATKTDGNPLLLRMVMGAGHAGASGRYDLLREIAHDHAFVLWALGLADDGALGTDGSAASADGTPPVAAG